MDNLNWNHTLADAMNAADLNRIESRTAELAERLRGYGYAARIVPRTVIRRKVTTEHKVITETFGATGAEQTFTAPEDGDYTIVATGAAGSGGNAYSGYATVGGKGARLTVRRSMKKGEALRLIVGQSGVCTQATSKDGTSGGGGGCTMVLRDISAITDSRYQFTKGAPFEVLLLAAGGGGGNDGSYQSSAKNGADGEAAQYKSPTNYTAMSAATGTSTTSAVMGVQQYITSNATGAVYSRNSGKAQGGYGCGGAADDTQAYGGGWCAGAASMSAASWSLDMSAVGENGVCAADGSVLIRCEVDVETVTETVAHDWVREDFPTPAELARIRGNIGALQDGFYSLPDWRELVQKFREDGRETLDNEQINAKEYDLHTLYLWLDRMAAAFLYAGEIYAGEVW